MPARGQRRLYLALAGRHERRCREDLGRRRDHVAGAREQEQRTMKVAQIYSAPERRKCSGREAIFAIEPIEDLTIIGTRQVEGAPIPPRENRRSAAFDVCRWWAAELQ